MVWLLWIGALVALLAVLVLVRNELVFRIRGIARSNGVEVSESYDRMLWDFGRWTYDGFFPGSRDP